LIRILSSILTILFLITGAGLSCIYYLYYIHESTKGEVILIIPKQSSSTEVGELLENAEVVDSSIIFQGFAYLHLKQKRYIQPGEYKFEDGLNLSQIFTKILTGDRYMRHITFPEGYTNFQVVNSLRNAYGLEGDVVLPIKEGSLMPDTYYYYYGEARVYIISAMSKTMERFINEAWEKRSADTAVKNKEEAIILASIIEKETGLSEERGKVSSVFNNRLKIGMPLQADPTVIYALKNGDTDYEYKLTKEDMHFNSPYNTYVYKGLPPTAICNPSRASISAALHPEQTNYLYFVADGKGGHIFSSNYQDHINNIKKN